VLLLPFALALALILAARRPQPASHPFSKAVAWSVAVLHCKMRCGARIAPQLSTTSRPSSSPLSLLCGIISSSHCFNLRTPHSLPPLSQSRLPPCPPALLPSSPPCDSQTRSLALVPAGQ
jgi:hypothetical protein